jgi:general secretion pathway protein L
MPSKLFVRPCEPYAAASAVYDWSLYDVAGMRLANGNAAALSDVEQMLMQNGVEQASLYLLWPSNVAFSTRIKIPGKQSRYLQQAIAFAIEDRLTQDLDLTHMAIGARSKQGTYPVVCVDKSLYLGFHDSVQDTDSHIDLRGSFLDAELLPRQEYDMVISIENGTCLVNSERHGSVGLIQNNLIPYLDTVFLSPHEDQDNKDQVFAIKLYQTEAELESNKLLIAELEQYPSLELHLETVRISQLDLLAESFFHNGEPSLDLCQGDFKLQNQNSASWSKWRWVAGIAVLAFLLQIGVFVGKGIYYQVQAEEIGAKALAAYKQAVPNSKTVPVSRLQRIIKGKLNQAQSSGSSAGFLALLGEAAYQYNRFPNKQGVSFTSINFNEQRGELVIELRSRNFEQLDQLKQAIVAAGYEVKISSAVQEDTYFRGRLSVSDS